MTRISFLYALCTSVASSSLSSVVQAAEGPVARAEALAAEALRSAAERPAAALEQARRALALTQDFDPTRFVATGRQGEVVEDAYREARAAYRRHRSLLYEAVGVSLARSGRQVEGARYLRRALELERRLPVATALARSLVALGRPREALAILLERPQAELPPELIAAAAAAADAARLPSLQAEIDAARLSMRREPAGVRLLPAPLVVPAQARLSTGGGLRLDAAEPWLVYLAETPCRTCSADLEALKRLAPPASRVALLPAEPDRDEALRRAVALYRYDWPYVMGAGVAGALGAKPPALLVIGRRGYSAVAIEAPVAAALPAVLEVYGRSDLREPLPRPNWNHRPPEREALPQRPGMRPDGFAPGEDEPAPEAFEKAVAAYAAGRPGEALAQFESLEAVGDGWLLPPEARLDRARCLAALGRRDEARRLLLRTGDSRFQDALDRALEDVGTR
jgi:tetratricopeptide (TPR) repeat protein